MTTRHGLADKRPIGQALLLLRLMGQDLLHLLFGEQALFDERFPNQPHGCDGAVGHRELLN